MPFGGGDFRGGDRIKRGNTAPRGADGGSWTVVQG